MKNETAIYGSNLEINGKRICWFSADCLQQIAETRMSGGEYCRMRTSIYALFHDNTLYYFHPQSTEPRTCAKSYNIIRAAVKSKL